MDTIVSNCNDTPIKVGDWRFYPISIVMSQQLEPQLKPVVQNVMEADAKDGKGLFANKTDFELQDEALDEYLMVDCFGMQNSLLPYLNELEKWGVVGDGALISDELTRGLFCVLKDAATFIKDNTDSPQKVKNHIINRVQAFDDIPIYGLFFQILLLQGLCKWLGGVNLNEGDGGYSEAQILYTWIYERLIEKELDFCLVPYGINDLQRLKPLCDYLISTETGKAVQAALFDRYTNHQSQNSSLEPQQESPKASTTKKQRLQDLVVGDDGGELVKKLHRLADGRKGKSFCIYLVAAVLEGLIQRPTYTQAKNEFGDIGCKTGYNKYMKKVMFTDEELEGAKNALT